MVSGAVLSGATTETIVDAGYTLIANPYPELVNITNITISAAGATAWDGDDNVPGWYNNAPTIMIPNGEGGYNFYYYAADGWDDDNETEYAGWCNKFGYIQKTISIPVMMGVWFKNDISTTITFTK